jgi:hypothetical protein
MLIKVQTAHNSIAYLLVDHVDSILYDAVPKEFKSQDELSDYIRKMDSLPHNRTVLDPQTGGLIPVDDPGTPTSPKPTRQFPIYTPNTLTYERNGHRNSIVFDTIAFICTDEGKTLERAYAGGALPSTPDR